MKQTIPQRRALRDWTPRSGARTSSLFARISSWIDARPDLRDDVVAGALLAMFWAAVFWLMRYMSQA